MCLRQERDIFIAYTIPSQGHSDSAAENSCNISSYTSFQWNNPMNSQRQSQGCDVSCGIHEYSSRFHAIFFRTFLILPTTPSASICKMLMQSESVSKISGYDSSHFSPPFAKQSPAAQPLRRRRYVVLCRSYGIPKSAAESLVRHKGIHKGIRW